MIRHRRTVALAAGMLALAACDHAPAPIRIIGSSTVYPFTKVVAAAFVDAKKGVQPIVEETGTVAGFARFCTAETADSADIADASRRMSKAEYQLCQANKVGDIMEVPIGLDGIAVAESTAGPKMALTSKDLYLALAANPMGKPNTAKLWKDVDPKLPAIPIRVIGPPPSSGTRDVFEKMVLQQGCVQSTPDAAKLVTGSDPAALDRVCHAIRADGPYLQGGENDNSIVDELERNPNTLGIFGYSFLEQNASRLRGLSIDGIPPEATIIASGKYPASRPLYLYVKLKHLKNKPALRAFLDQYVAMWAPGGPLEKRGLIMMSEGARQRSVNRIQNGEAIDAMSLS